MNGSCELHRLPARSI